MTKMYTKDHDLVVDELQRENSALRRHQADIVSESVQFQSEAKANKAALRDQIAMGIIHGTDGIVRDMLKNTAEGEVDAQIVDFVCKAYDVADLALEVRKHKTEAVLKTFELWKQNPMGMRFNEFLQKTLDAK